MVFYALSLHVLKVLAASASPAVFLDFYSSLLAHGNEHMFACLDAMHARHDGSA